MFTTNVTKKTPQKKCYQEEKEREGGYVGNIYISFTIYCFHIVIKLHDNKWESSPKLDWQQNIRGEVMKMTVYGYRNSSSFLWSTTCEEEELGSNGTKCYR